MTVPLLIGVFKTNTVVSTGLLTFYPLLVAFASQNPHFMLSYPVIGFAALTSIFTWVVTCFIEKNQSTALKTYLPYGLFLGCILLALILGTNDVVYNPVSGLTSRGRGGGGYGSGGTGGSMNGYTS